ncbi:MAG TPA: hypothetical protein PLE14_07645, partial [Anaerolineales bacterium]|nr:hypothetical protein [Anaerolineales bacterium]
TLLTMQTFLAQGWGKILLDRLIALASNLGSGFAAHGGIILFPFIVAGVIYHRKDERVRLGALAWFILFFVMSFLFPFAGARGAFFHTGAALQPLWWVLAPLGLDGILSSLRSRKNWGDDRTPFVFRSALVMIVIILTFYVVHLRIFVLGWGEKEEINYPAAEALLLQNGITDGDVVIVGNAPAYYLATGRSAISIPYGGLETIQLVSRQFGADYLVLEPSTVLPQLETLMANPQQESQVLYLGEVNGVHIFKLR